jgi:hypothetical protein
LNKHKEFPEATTTGQPPEDHHSTTNKATEISEEIGSGEEPPKLATSTEISLDEGSGQEHEQSVPAKLVTSPSEELNATTVHAEVTTTAQPEATTTTTTTIKQQDATTQQQQQLTTEDAKSNGTSADDNKLACEFHSSEMNSFDFSPKLRSPQARSKRLW